MKIKEITAELLNDKITLDRDTLGEPRLRGHRLSVTHILYALKTARGDVSLAAIAQKQFDWNISDEDVDACLVFAAEFLHEVFCDDELFSNEDLQEFPRLDK